ncbi:MAG: hypothetical protein HY532_01150 [Chloroflexi bacterium]|nr:hypothetical protein [Chloroflexota bacterium]MBI4201707.1 hypothetical protein [Chloroflexota bacterium]
MPYVVLYKVDLNRHIGEYRYDVLCRQCAEEDDLLEEGEPISGIAEVSSVQEAARTYWPHYNTGLVCEHLQDHETEVKP